MIILRLCEGREAERRGNSGAVGGVGAGAVVDVAPLDVIGGIAHRARRVVEKRLALVRIHGAEQVARLLPMVVVDAVVPVRADAINGHGRFGEVGLVSPQTIAVG